MASGVREEIQRRLTGLSAVGGLVDVAEDEFAFAAGVGGADEARDARGIEDFADDFELIAVFS